MNLATAPSPLAHKYKVFHLENCTFCLSEKKLWWCPQAVVIVCCVCAPMGLYKTECIAPTNLLWWCRVPVSSGWRLGLFVGTFWTSFCKCGRFYSSESCLCARRNKRRSGGFAVRLHGVPLWGLEAARKEYQPAREGWDEGGAGGHSQEHWGQEASHPGKKTLFLCRRIVSSSNFTAVGWEGRSIEWNSC